MAATKRAAVLAGKPAVTKAAAIEDAHQVHRDRRSETKFDAGTGEYEGGEGNAERRAVVVNRIHELAKWAEEKLL